MKLHPILLMYRRSEAGQECLLCGAGETWLTARAKSHASANLSEVEQWNIVHLIHLVQKHLADVHETFLPAGRAKEVTEAEVRKQVTASRVS